jgi:hypothetical protein
MKRKFKFIFFILGLGVFWIMNQNQVFAQASNQHPRVMELENELTHQAQNYLKSRFPDRPFLVTVSVDPLFRYDNTRNNLGERLPFFDVDSEEIRDEWDDPQYPLTALMSRVRKIVVNISVPHTVTDDEMLELKDAVFNQLHLSKARDNVEIVRKTWKNEVSGFKAYAVFVSIILVALLVGFYFIGRQSVDKIVGALKSSKNSSSGAISSASPMQSPIMGQSSNAQGLKNSSHALNSENDVHITYTLKLQEVTERVVKIISQSQFFPSLYDMILLDQEVKSDPQSVGALLAEFPENIQKRIFEFSTLSQSWLQVFIDQGNLTKKSLEIAIKLVKNQKLVTSSECNDCLIAIWRMQEKIPQFLKELGQEKAISILNYFPKSIAVPYAKEAFPGAWAQVLDSKSSSKLFSKEDAKFIFKRAIEIFPLGDESILNRYKNDRELAQYLKYASPRDEKEIYESLPSNSMLFSIRPPFYILFGQSSEVIEQIIKMYTPEQLAYALYNTEMDLRKNIIDKFNEKQRFLFSDKMKRIDKENDKEIIASIREDIAHKLNQVLQSIEVNKVVVMNTGESDNENNNKPQDNFEGLKAA